MKTLLILFSFVFLAFAHGDDDADKVFIEVHRYDEPPFGDDTGKAEGPSPQSSRARRSLRKGDTYRWNKGVVPYVFKNGTIRQHTLDSIYYAMSVYEYYTCIRFVPWYKGINKDMGLANTGYVVLSHGSGAYVGNLRHVKNGQGAGCYGERSCIHEIGHALGFYHEHSNPDYKGWISVNIHNAKPASLPNFTPRTHNVNYGYDLQSYMNYNTYEFSRNSRAGLETISVLFPDLWLHHNPYYMMLEISKTHSCHATPQCKGVTTKCENDGFLTVLAGKCSCRCPRGLDPATGCTTILKAVASDITLPKGQYGLPMHTDGCPDSTFTEGTRTHFGKDGMSVFKPKSLNGIFSGKEAEQKFCMRNQNDDSMFQWPIGNYCYYRKGGKCPTKQKGFYSNNYILFYDKRYKNPILQNSASGVLPDGVYNSAETKLDLCCTWSGRYVDPMMLPNKKPFILLKRGGTCQEVQGMNVRTENFGFAYEKKPKIKGPTTYTDSKRVYIHHCVYTPLDTDCGQVIDLTDSNPVRSIELHDTNKGDKQCTWLIKGPSEKGRIAMVFDTFDVDCKDKLEVRFARLGHTGITYCGQKPLHPIYSILDKMMVQLKTLTSSQSYFKATFKWIPDSDLCYNTADNGATYDGKVNVTRYLEPCLPWSEVTQCLYNAYDENPSISGLEENYCRNPDDTFMPWCYTDVKKCRRNYCDACNSAASLQANPSPKPDDLKGCPPGFTPHGYYCYRFVNDKKTYQDAEQTCESYGSTLAMPKTTPENEYLANRLKDEVWIGLTDRLNERRFVWADGVLANWFNWVKGQPNNHGNQDCVFVTYNKQWHDQKCTLKYKFFCQTIRYSDALPTSNSQKASGVHCDTPVTTDGILLGHAKAQYAVGETARFTCRSLTSRVATRTCLTSGQWSAPLSACLVCPQGFALHGDSCFAMFDYPETYEKAQGTCRKHGATLALPKTQEENNYLVTGLIKQDVWIGLTDKVKENVFVWNDGTAITWTNWESGQPNNYRNQDCIALKPNKVWYDDFCSAKKRFVCQADKYDGGSCMDSIPWCARLRSAKPDMCLENRSFAVKQCSKTCGVCDKSTSTGVDEEFGK